MVTKVFNIQSGFFSSVLFVIYILWTVITFLVRFHFNFQIHDLGVTFYKKR